MRGKSREGIVIDVKYVERLTAAYMKQINIYAGHPLYAKRKVIVCRTDTIVPKAFVDAGISVMRILPTPNELAASLA